MLRSSVTRKLSGSAAVETGSAALASVAASTLPGAPTARPIAARCASESGASIAIAGRSEEHTSELQSLMRISYAVFCLKKKKKKTPSQDSTKITVTQTIKNQTQERNE